METPEFSIIIPTYNREGTLAAAIESVINQVQGDWELIIVDDGSTDATKSLVDQLKTDSRISYYFQKNQGVSSARNLGVEKAQGNFVLFLDSDDKFERNLLAALKKSAYQKHDLVCWEVVKNINGKLSIWKPVKLGPLYNGIVASFLAGSCCYRKEIFNRVGGYDAKMSFGENYELGMRICEIDNLKIKILNIPLLRVSLNSLTRISDSIPNRLSSYIYLYKKHKKKYRQHPAEEALMNYLLGHVLEKSNRKHQALKFYKSSFKLNPLNLKAILKILLLKIRF